MAKKQSVFLFLKQYDKRTNMNVRRKGLPKTAAHGKKTAFILKTCLEFNLADCAYWFSSQRMTLNRSN
jgi:hypothetical protein